METIRWNDIQYENTKLTVQLIHVVTRKSNTNQNIEYKTNSILHV